MSEEDNQEEAPVEDADTLDMPIDIIGDKVKSGRNVLADYDAATGAVEVRTKWKHMTEAIRAVVDEVEEGKEAESFRGKGVPVAVEAIHEANAKLDALHKEAEKLQEEVVGNTIPGVDMSKLDPNIAAILISQQQQMTLLMEKMNKDSESVAASRAVGVVEEGKREQKLHAERLKDDILFAQNNNVPLPPKKNPQFGDKTPSYVDWLKDHRPNLYIDRYGITDQDQQITLRTRDGSPVKVRADIGRRKTHTTQKPEQDPSLAADMDWNA